ncbi:hypothetical protein [Nonomuraea sp. NPDC050783]|uniref:hypothetical protein n=1 Tax=Nonomuraea sp. NPDC050783 TaxID=3154634 RepID=UPI00346722B6
MPSKEQVLRLLAEGQGYEEAARRLGIPPGRAYLIATGVPADGSETVVGPRRRDRPGLLPTHPQHLVNPRTVSPTGREDVRAWVRERARGERAAAGKDRRS